jgi:DNA-binding NarL/FixJ family response regulator
VAAEVEKRHDRYMSMATTARALLDTPHDFEDLLNVGVISDSQLLSSQIRGTIGRAGCELALELGPDEVKAGNLDRGAVDVVVACAGQTCAERLDVFKAVRAAFPDVPVLGIWPNADKGDERRALKTGIEGLIREVQIEAALPAAVRAIRSGLTCVPLRMRSRLQREALSSREKQVLGMLIMGFTNAQIAGRLFLAESTVKSHLSSAYTKLGVRSRKDAVALILDPAEGLGPGILAISGT